MFTTEAQRHGETTSKVTLELTEMAEDTEGSADATWVSVRPENW